MGAKQILIANPDLRTLGEHGRALGQDWKVTLVADSTEALAALAETPCDVIIADAALPEVNGKELLDRVHDEYPKIIRILLASEADKDMRIADVQGSHLILTKPCDQAALKSAVERALAINQWLASDSLRELVGRLRTFPIVPSLYLEVVNALKSPHTTTAEIGAIIAKDMAMMTKLLQVTNSACFGLPRKISDPVEAVGILGFETVKTMVMTLKLLSQYDKVKPVYFSIDRLWRHSTEVARIARRVVRAQTDDPILAESAFTAGLMHDVGKLILAANFDDQYSGAQDLARKRQIPLVEVEQEIFGASHGVIGAYLLGLWGMPLDMVETAALHHHPSRSSVKQLSPLAAVHVADALYYEVNPDKQGFLPPAIDQDYLAALGLSDRVKLWRETIVAPPSGATEFRAKSTQTAVFRKSAANAPKASLRVVSTSPTPLPVASSWLSPQKRWLYRGLAAAVFLLLFWIGTQALLQRALEPTAGEPEPTAKTASPVPAPISPNEPAQPSPPATPAQVAAQPVDQPVPAPAPVAPYHPAPATPPSAKDLAFAELQLESIYFSRTHPRAVISGRAVQTNDRLPAGAVVVQILPSSVVLQFDNERRTLALK